MRTTMDTDLKKILAELPIKPPRSRLEPYREFIEELRSRGRTYRDIADILAEKCSVQVTGSGVHDFVRTRSRAKTKLAGRGTKSICSLPPIQWRRNFATIGIQRGSAAQDRGSQSAQRGSGTRPAWI